MRVDYLIVGQGLAGTLIANHLASHKRSFLVVDENHREAASRVACGIINPITGRRFVKSWLHDLLMETAIPIYRQLEESLDINLLRSRKILRSIPGPAAKTDWLIRSSEPAYVPYIGKLVKFNHSNQIALDEVLEVKGGYQLDMPLLIHTYRQKLRQDGQIWEQSFSFKDLQIKDCEVTYKQVRAKGIIFCEGQRMRFNPLFNHLPLQPSVGECIKIRIRNLSLDALIKKKYFLAPLGDELFWYGAYSHWQLDAAIPTEKARNELLSAATQMITEPLELISNAAAIRPTVRDRRPLLGVHTSYSNVFVFNGLGSKGASLGPYLAQKMIAFIIDSTELPDQVSISRFNGRADG